MAKVKKIIRIRTKWEPGDSLAIVGFIGDIPADTPIIFTESNGRIGWEEVKKEKEKG